ncbi:hypothetical protein BC832DRAFT_541370 [Gaertneriomyces semiglobifer]|nr:hypothetical protein BC832DRAFT_541370 [Gaertneriomyces semiglobifer]
MDDTHTDLPQPSAPPTSPPATDSSTVASSPVPLPGQRTVLIGIDSITKHGLQSSPVLHWALRQFLVAGDTVYVVHASKSLDPTGMGQTGNAAQMNPELLKKAELFTEDIVRGMCRNMWGNAGGHHSRNVKAHVVKGDPREVMKGLAMEHNATAVIVGRRGTVSTVRRMLLGSVSDYLARELDSTVIIVKE